MFYSIRVTGKNWNFLPEIHKYCTNLVASSKEITVSCDNCYIDVIIIEDEQHIVNDFRHLLIPYEFKSVSISDVQTALKNICGLKGYLTDSHLVIL